MPRLIHRLSVIAAGSLPLGSLLPSAPAFAAEPMPEPGPAASEGAPADATDRIVVKFKKGKAPGAAGRDKAYDQAAAEVDATAEEVRTTATGAKIVETDRTLDADEAADVAEALEARPDVEYAEPDNLLRPTVTPNDTYFDLQWGLFNDGPGMRLPDAWEKSTGAGTVVAVIDTGITTHSDLDANVLPGYDMVADAAMARDGDGRDADPSDPGDWCEAGSESSWHGTHVAGIVASAGNNGKGVTGVAYGAKVLPVRALGACGGYESDVADALVWAAGGTVSGAPANAHPADVANLSLGGTAACSTSMQKAIDYATGRATTVVVAAGNENQPVANSAPANCQNVIAVAAAGPAGNRAPYSNYGAGIDVTAPGGDMTASAEGGIASTINAGTTIPAGEGYAWMEGTSMAAPHVAGLAALMLAADATLTPAAVEEKMKAAAHPISSCNAGCGAGLVDAAAALGVAGPPSSPAPQLSAGTPSVTGTAAVGSVLVANPGSWTEGVKLAYQWYRNHNPVTGATGSRYTLTAADLGGTIRVEVTGTLPGYDAASRDSAETAPVVRGTLTAAAPVIYGAAKAGSTLTAITGAWTTGTRFSYRWYRNGTAVAGATGSGYRLTTADVGAAIRVRVTGSLPGYDAAFRDSAGTSPIARAALTAPTPTITGTAKVGYTLTARKGTWTSGASVKYQWLRNGRNITGATGSAYRLTASDAGARMQVRTTGTLTGYETATRTSAYTVAVKKGTLTSSEPKLSGTLKVGSTLAAKPGTWTAGTTRKYQWYRSGHAIKGANSYKYKITSADRGDRLRVKVTGSKKGYASKNRYSDQSRKL